MSFSFNEKQNAIRELVACFSAEFLASSYRVRGQESLIKQDVIRELHAVDVLRSEKAYIYVVNEACVGAVFAIMGL